MTPDFEDPITIAINEAEEITDPKPDLLVHRHDLPETARGLRDLFVKAGLFFDRGGPVKLVWFADGEPPSAVLRTVSNVVFQTHKWAQPIRQDDHGTWKPITLPDRVARMYLDMEGDWNLPPLSGVTTAPLLTDDGGVLARD